MGMSTALIELEHLSLGWRDKVAVRDISGQFLQGGLYALVGPNGAGKSTLLKGLMGEIAPLHGQIHLHINHATELAFLPQQADIDRSFPITVYDLVAMGAWSRIGYWGRVSQAERQRITYALEQVGLVGFAKRSINTLSGGQFQRALFARLLMQDASVILLDEPFAAVDTETTQDLLALILQWHQQGRTIIAVLHELDMVRHHFPTSVLLGGQLVAWGPSSTVLTPENLHMARHLCAGDYL
ncbi:metal ABC transporter ATP-binding protein [Paenalcaligenes hominis]